MAASPSLSERRTESEVSERFGLTNDTLRYYERLGLLGVIPRDSSGDRSYTEENCSRIGFIKCMRDAGVSIEALIQYTKLLGEGPKTHDQRKQILIEQREVMHERAKQIQHGIDTLDYKIENYDAIMKDVK